MEAPPRPTSTSLFQVYLRLRPALNQYAQQALYPQLTPPAERFLTVETPLIANEPTLPTHITIHPPSDSRKRAVEKFAFTKVFEEEATQLDIFRGTGAISLVEGVLGEGRDGLLATLGVTGSGKSHTILGSKSQRGLTQLSLDLLYRSLGYQVLHPTSTRSLISSLDVADASEAQILPASGFLDGIYGDVMQERGSSRAPTPMLVGRESSSSSVKPMRSEGLWSQWSILGLSMGSSPQGPGRKKMPSITPVPEIVEEDKHQPKRQLPSQLPFWNTPRMTRTKAKLRFGTLKQESSTPTVSKRNMPQRPSTLPQLPDIRDFTVTASSNTDYAILVSMYEVYNDRIFDLLCHPRNLKDLRRRPLLFKSTEASPDRKVVAGLRKIVCGSYEEALIVLETGLLERRVAGTGSNSVSSRSHGFFCVEVKKRPRGGISNAWSGAQLTAVDLAGSERARNAKTAGATLAEAGKINESLMYLGQCLQMQSDSHDGNKPSIVPFRQCKLTELLFSNSYPSSSNHTSNHVNHHSHHRNAQKAVMIVTADPLGDFNATSQILRYSALAREVTVPRIPSVTSTIFSGININQGCNRSQLASSGRTTPHDNTVELEAATFEVEKLNEEVTILAMRLADEQERRREAEEAWQRAEEKAEEMEREVREECWNEMERRIEEERRRWKGAWGEEADRNDEHLDRKLELLTRGIQIHEDTPQTETTTTRITELEDENTTLHRKLAALEREMQCRSPTKARRPKPSQPRTRGSAEWPGEEEEQETLAQLKEVDLNEMGPAVGTMEKEGKTVRKVRKLTAKRMEYAGLEEGWSSS